MACKKGTVKINGKEYIRHGPYYHESLANEEADNYRTVGVNTKVRKEPTKYIDEYYVYTEVKGE